jgi:type IV secretion system protein VirB11
LSSSGETGERFEGLLPPVVAGPAFAIRKPAVAVFTLDDYVAGGIMHADQAAVLRAAVAARKNILIAGGTSTGKTTLTNALLAEMAPEHSGFDSRVILIEDTRELQCPLPDTVALRTRPPHVSMTELVRSTMRLRPDRIVVGEVRGPEALDMLKWMVAVMDRDDRSLMFVASLLTQWPQQLKSGRLRSATLRFVMQQPKLPRAAFASLRRSIM